MRDLLMWLFVLSVLAASLYVALRWALNDAREERLERMLEEGE